MGSLRKITNQSDYSISYIKMEHKDNCGHIAQNDSKDMDVWFPWVDNPGQFVNKTIIIEIIGVSRIYLWESGGNLWYSISDEYLEGPFTKTTKITISGDEFSKGKLVPGEYTSGNRELEIRNNHNNISIKMYNY